MTTKQDKKEEAITNNNLTIIIQLNESLQEYVMAIGIDLAREYFFDELFDEFLSVSGVVKRNVLSDIEESLCSCSGQWLRDNLSKGIGYYYFNASLNNSSINKYNFELFNFKPLEE